MSQLLLPAADRDDRQRAHDTHVFTVQHSRRVSGVQNSSTACYGITPKKSSHFLLLALGARTLFFTHTPSHSLTHTHARMGGALLAHFNLYYHTCPRRHARHLLRKCSAKTFTYTTTATMCCCWRARVRISSLPKKNFFCLQSICSPSLSLSPPGEIFSFSSTRMTTRSEVLRDDDDDDDVLCVVL